MSANESKMGKFCNLPMLKLIFTNCTLHTDTCIAKLLGGNKAMNFVTAPCNSFAFVGTCIFKTPINLMIMIHLCTDALAVVTIYVVVI